MGICTLSSNDYQELADERATEVLCAFRNRHIPRAAPQSAIGEEDDGTGGEQAILSHYVEISDENWERYGDEFVVDGIDPDHTNDVLLLHGVDELNPDEAEALAEFGGDTVILPDLTHLSPEVASILAEWKGQDLGLSGLRNLSAEAAAELAQWAGSSERGSSIQLQLRLDGLVELNPDAASPWQNGVVIAGRNSWDIGEEF